MRSASREELTRAAVNRLIKVADADRGGAWVAGPHHTADWWGHVEDKASEATPTAWTRVNPTLTFLKLTLESGEPTIQNIPEDLEVMTFGPMIGIRTVLWLPLQFNERTLGLAFVAWKRRRNAPISVMTKRIGDEFSIALAGLAHGEAAKSLELELASRDRIQKAILVGTSADEGLRLILGHAKRFTSCAFTAVGLENDGMSCQIVEGTTNHPIAFHLHPLKEACARCLAENAPVRIEDYPSGRTVTDRAARAASSVWVFPLDLFAGSEPVSRTEKTSMRLGVLIAGFVPNTEGPHDRGRLEGCASLVALALGIHNPRLWKKEASSIPIKLEFKNENSQHRTESEKLEFETLLDCLETGVLIFDAAGKLRMANQSFSQFFGMNLRQVYGASSCEGLAELLAERSVAPDLFRARWRDIAHNADVASWDEFDLAHPVRRSIERFARRVLNADGLEVGWLEVWRDVTGLRLQQAKLDQKEKMATLGQLVSSVAHELNNPLTSIMGYAQLLFTRNRPSELNADLAKIHDEAERASRIIKNLLLRSREHGSQREPVDLNGIVQRTLALRKHNLEAENISVTCELDPEVMPVLADAGQMQQVVLNLVLNAEQSIGLNRGTGIIRIRTRNGDDHHITLEVADDGPGVPAAIAARIFDPFFTTKPAGAGTGLGLSIITGIVQAHGGFIHLVNRPGSGAVFQVGLPRALRGPQTSSPKETPIITSGREAHRLEPVSWAEVQNDPKNLLVVEDEPTVAQLISDVLRAQGHRVAIVLDSREGLSLAERENFDLVICDLKMPHVDGRAFYHTLMRKGNPLQNRIIFVTGDTMALQTMEFLEAYRLPYLAKPFLVDELKAAVEKVFRVAPQKARAASNSGRDDSSSPARKR